MSELVIEHVDETGAPCARHTAATPESLFRLAMVGSRARVFHHDCASKLQALVMVLDEIRQLTEQGEPQLVEAVEAALESMQEVNAVLNTNRALTRPSTRSAMMLRELVTSAAGWVGVTLHGTLPDEMVDVATPSTIHALSLAFDIAAGAGRGRTLTVAALRTTREVELVLHTAPSQPANASEALAIATFVIARDGGRLWCAAAGDRIFVRLPCA
ncbi:MAG TPA: hypothetical protein VHN14_02940 [Kofleriaceae bacterium]|jgi:hypothetical protein|nr:hypothetical protein [Kofleriaceae bacterium]